MIKKLSKGIPAVDFELMDTRDRLVCITNFMGKKNVVLVLNRGFV